MGSKERLELLALYTGLETVTALAEAAGIKSGTAQKHKDRNSIPKKAAPAYQETARKFGVDASLEWIMAGRGSAPKRPLVITPRAINKLSTEAPVTPGPAEVALELPLWQIRDLSRSPGEPVLQIYRSEDTVIAPIVLKNFKSAFAVRVWDASNGPYLPRGTILYVERPYGGAAGDLCLFASEATETEVMRPIIGILLAESMTDGHWQVQRNTEIIQLPKREFPLCWRIKHTKRD